MSPPRIPRVPRFRLAAALLALAFPALAQDGPAVTAWGAAAAVRLEHAVAAEVVESLNAHFTNQAVRLAEVRADKTDNSVVIFARDRHDLDTMREMVAELDVAPPSFVFETAVFEIGAESVVFEVGSETNRESALAWFSRSEERETPAICTNADFTGATWFAMTDRSPDEFRSVARSNCNARIAGCPIVCAQGEREAVVEMSDTIRHPDGSTRAWGFRLALTPRARKDGCVSLTAKARFLPNNDPEEAFDGEIDVLLRPGETVAWGGFPRDDGTDRLVLIRLRPTEDAEAAARAEGERLARESAAFVPADPESRLAPAAAPAPAAFPLDLSVRFVEASDDAIRAAFAEAVEPFDSTFARDEEVSSFARTFDAATAAAILARLTNAGARVSFSARKRWSEPGPVSFADAVAVSYRTERDGPVQSRDVGSFLSVEPRTYAPPDPRTGRPKEWRVALDLTATRVSPPTPETAPDADGFCARPPFFPLRSLATCVDITPGSTVFFLAGGVGADLRPPLFVLECRPSREPLPPLPATAPEPTVPEGFAHRMYSVPWMASAAAEFPYLVPTNATAPSGEAVLALARELGADIPDGSTAKYMPQIGKLVVETSPAALAEIERLLAALGGASGGRVEIAASILAVADADLDSFLDRFGVTNTAAALLAPVLARQPTLDDLRDLAESPPAADLAPSFGSTGNCWRSTDGIARTVVGNDECAKLSCNTEYVFPSVLRWGGTDVPAPGGGAVSNRAVIVRDPQDFQTRSVGPRFRVVPRLRPGDGHIHLSVRFEYTGDPVWARIPSAGVPLRRADGSYAMVRSGYVEGSPPWYCGGETPEFPSFVAECALDVADGEAALLRPFPDPNAPADAPRFFVPVVSARRAGVAAPPPAPREKPSPETIARRRAIVEDGVARRRKGDREGGDASSPRITWAKEPNGGRFSCRRTPAIRSEGAETDFEIEGMYFSGGSTNAAFRDALAFLSDDADPYGSTILSRPQTFLVLDVLSKEAKTVRDSPAGHRPLLAYAEPLRCRSGDRVDYRADEFDLAVSLVPGRVPDAVDLAIRRNASSAPTFEDFPGTRDPDAETTVSVYSGSTVCLLAPSRVEGGSPALLLLRVAMLPDAPAPVRPSPSGGDGEKY